MRRIFYAASAGNIIESHEAWRRGEQNPTEVSITFSSQIEDFAAALGAEAYLVSRSSPAGKVRDGAFVLEHLPKPSRTGLAFHIGELIYALRLLARARRFGADIALIDTGVAHMFLFTMFRLCGIRVLPILHNTLWPAHFPPQGMRAWVRRLDRLFWRHVPMAAIGVSPECVRQVRTEAPRHRYPLLETRAQFIPDFFSEIPPPPAWERKPFRVMFVGRVRRAKGVLDIVRMARMLEDRAPGRVHWTICGRGPALDEVRALIVELDVSGAVEAPGWVTREEYAEIRARSHAAIVPTTSRFEEGMAMTAIESVLSGRPVVLNPVVPAIDVIGPATVAGRTNDFASHAEAVWSLASDREAYERARLACPGLGQPFYDRSQGLDATLRRALTEAERAGTLPAARHAAKK